MGALGSTNFIARSINLSKIFRGFENEADNGGAAG
jgi:hypothetical protein